MYIRRFAAKRPIVLGGRFGGQSPVGSAVGRRAIGGRFGGWSAISVGRRSVGDWRAIMFGGLRPPGTGESSSQVENL